MPPKATKRKNQSKAAAAGPIRFGGRPTIPSPEVFERAVRSNPLWAQVLEKGFIQFAQRPENAGRYGDPTGKGASLEEMWRTFGLFRVFPYCVLVREMPPEQLADIERLIQSTPQALLQDLKRLQKLDGSLNVTTLHYDGQTGHCIRLTAYDLAHDRFIYHDPWPEKSLLCAENNMAGVDAQPADGRWSVTAAELESVLFASFLFPSQQLRLQGVDFELTFDSWKESEFFKFFHLKQMDEGVQRGVRQRLFTAGPFKQAVMVLIDLAESDKITAGRLLLERGWLMRQLPLGLDIAKSFLKAFAPAPDKAAYEEIGAALWRLREPEYVRQMQQSDPKGSTVAECVHAFLGSTEKAFVPTDLGSISINTLTRGDLRIHQIEIQRS